MPPLQSQEGIGAQQTKEHIRGLELASQALQGIKGVVGLPAGQGRIHVARREPGFSCHGQPYHGQPVLKAGMGGAALKRLGAYGRDQHLVERQPGDGRPGDRDVTTMRRIKGAPEEGDAHRASYRDRLYPRATSMPTAYIALGSNLGRPRGNAIRRERSSGPPGAGGGALLAL